MFNFLKSYQDNEQGSIATIFATSIGVVVITAAVTLNHLSKQAAYVSFQAAADNAALAALSFSAEEGEPEAIAREVFFSNLTPSQTALDPEFNIEIVAEENRQVANVDFRHEVKSLFGSSQGNGSDSISGSAQAIKASSQPKEDLVCEKNTIDDYSEGATGTLYIRNCVDYKGDFIENLEVDYTVNEVSKWTRTFRGSVQFYGTLDVPRFAVDFAEPTGGVQILDYKLRDHGGPIHTHLRSHDAEGNMMTGLDLVQNLEVESAREVSGATNGLKVSFGVANGVPVNVAAGPHYGNSAHWDDRNNYSTVTIQVPSSRIDINGSGQWNVRGYRQQVDIGLFGENPPADFKPKEDSYVYLSE